MSMNKNHNHLGLTKSITINRTNFVYSLILPRWENQKLDPSSIAHGNTRWVTDLVLDRIKSCLGEAFFLYTWVKVG